jgi:predicted secreted protein
MTLTGEHSMLKKTIVAAALSLACSTFAGTTQQVVLTSNKTPIHVAAGKTFDIVLASNQTTGYSWKWDKNTYDSNLISKVSHQYVAPSNKKLMGAPGYEVWTFTAKPAKYSVVQVGHIVMEYQRPWEKKPGTKKTFIVHIK